MVSPITNDPLALFLKVVQMSGFTRQLSESSEMWDKIGKFKAGDAHGKQLKYLLNDALGYAAVQALPADGSGIYPMGQKSSLKEAAATYKEWAYTVTVPRVVLNKEGGLDAQYAKTLAAELENKAIAMARLKCVEIQGDGSGAIGVINGAPSVVSGKLRVVISHTSANAGRSFIRWFQEGDHVKIHTTAGVTHNTAATSTVAAYWQVGNINETTPSVDLTPYSAAGVALTAVAAQFDAATTDVIYRKDAATPDLTAAGIAAGTVDMESLSHNMVGMESLFADDSRLVQGINKSGNYRATVSDLGGALLDNSHFQVGLSTAKRRGGRKFSYKQAFMADEAYDSLVASNETDRRFGEVDDIKRGLKTIGYKHRKDQIEFASDEFVHVNRIWVLPEGKDILSFIGGMPTQVSANGGDKYRLSLGTNAAGQQGYGREDVTSFEQQGVLITKFAAPALVIKNFTTVLPA